MMTNSQTITLSKIRRELMKLARTEYAWKYTGRISDDVKEKAIKVYDIVKNEKNKRKN